LCIDEESNGVRSFDRDVGHWPIAPIDVLADQIEVGAKDILSVPHQQDERD
jgi:hypothetical protein